MAVTLAEEALRIVQDAFPFHETLLSEHALRAAQTHLYTAPDQVQLQERGSVAACLLRHTRLARLVAVGYASCVVVPFLAWGRRMDVSSALDTYNDSKCDIHSFQYDHFRVPHVRIYNDRDSS